MQSWTLLRIALLALCGSSLGGWYDIALGAQVSGSIRFADENFDIDVHTRESSLELTARGCNNFDLSLASPGQGASIELRDSKNALLGTIAASKILESRTCKSDRYLTELMFAQPTTTKWLPRADDSLGTKKVQYVATLSPVEIRFDPAIELTIFDKNKRARPIRVSGVARASIQGNGELVFSSDALHFQTTAATIRRHGGMTASDQFSLSSDGRLLTPPEVGSGSEMTLAALPNEPIALSLYYPLRGPHVLAFFEDEAQGTPTSLASLRAGSEQLLTPELAVVRADTMTLDRGAFDFLSGEDKLARGSLVLNIGTAAAEVRDVQIVSNHENLTIEQGSAPEGVPSVRYASVPGGMPFEVPLRVRIPQAWKPGEHSIPITVSSEGGLERQIPLTVKITDRHGTTRALLLGVLAAIVVALGIGAVAKRRRAQSQEAAIRTHFIQRQYDDLVRYRERVEGLLASDSLTWLQVEQLFHEFQAARMQTGLTPSQWHAVSEAAKQEKPRETLEALERALARFDA